MVDGSSYKGVLRFVVDGKVTMGYGNQSVLLKWEAGVFAKYRKRVGNKKD
jgi:hypothetical protein